MTETYVLGQPVTNNRTEDGCRILQTLQQAHDWAHMSMDVLSSSELAAAKALSERILSLMNFSDNYSNGSKLLAVLYSLESGMDELKAEATPQTARL